MRVQRIVEYERLLIGLKMWDANDDKKFPRFMMIAEEAEGDDDAWEDISADGVSGRVRKHLAASTQEVTTHVDDRVDALEKQIGAMDSQLEKKMDSKLNALSTKMLEAIAGVQAPK